MSKRFYCRVIESVESRCINEEDQQNLISIFESTVSTMSTTLAREARFELVDFIRAWQKGLVAYSLHLTKQPDADRWTGVFEQSECKMTIVARLEKE